MEGQTNCGKNCTASSSQFFIILICVKIFPFDYKILVYNWAICPTRLCLPFHICTWVSYNFFFSIKYNLLCAMQTLKIHIVKKTLNPMNMIPTVRSTVSISEISILLPIKASTDKEWGVCTYCFLDVSSLSKLKSTFCGTISIPLLKFIRVWTVWGMSKWILCSWSHHWVKYTHFFILQYLFD